MASVNSKAFEHLYKLLCRHFYPLFGDPRIFRHISNFSRSNLALCNTNYWIVSLLLSISALSIGKIIVSFQAIALTCFLNVHCPSLGHLCNLAIMSQLHILYCFVQSFLVVCKDIPKPGCFLRLALLLTLSITWPLYILLKDTHTAQ